MTRTVQAWPTPSKEGHVPDASESVMSKRSLAVWQWLRLRGTISPYCSVLRQAPALSAEDCPVILLISTWRSLVARYGNVVSHGYS